MELIGLPAGAGEPDLWINPDHLVSVARIRMDTGRQIKLAAELKLEGLPLQRVTIGLYDTGQAAGDAWTAFLAHLVGTTESGVDVDE